MGQLEILFEVPSAIEMGLASGQLERIGGVIVDSQTRNIVCWLRDGAIQTATSSANPLGTIIQAADMATSLYDNHLTRETINRLTSNIRNLTVVMASGQLLNLALTATTLQVLMTQLDKLSTQIEALSKQVTEEFKRDRDTRFKVALQATRDVFESNQEELSRGAIRSAINGLFEARENFLRDYYHTLDIASSREDLLQAHHYLLRAMYAETSRIRCYIESNDLELAVQRLREDLPLFQSATKRLIRVWQGESPAIYFHKDVPEETLERFLHVEMWLRGDRLQNNPRGIFQILNDLRSDFWNDAVLENSILQIVTRRTGQLDEGKLEQLADNMLQAEILIENLERLRGFELEISSMRLRVDDWANIIEAQEHNESDASIVVDVEYLESLNRLTID